VADTIGLDTFRRMLRRQVDFARFASSPDPSRPILRELFRHGENSASEFLTALGFEAWREQNPDAVLDFFTDDSELVSVPPFPAHGPSRGTAPAAGCANTSPATSAST
jgi:hypothetical protein